MAGKAKDYVNSGMTTLQNVTSTLQQAANEAEKPENKSAIQSAINAVNTAKSNVITPTTTSNIPDSICNTCVALSIFDTVSIKYAIAAVSNANAVIIAERPNNDKKSVLNNLTAPISKPIATTNTPKLAANTANARQTSSGFIFPTVSINSPSIFTNNPNDAINIAHPTVVCKVLNPSATDCNGFLPLPNQLIRALSATKPSNAAPASFNQSQKVKCDTASIIFPMVSPTFSSILFNPSH